MKRDFASSCSLITRRQETQSLRLDFSPSVRLIMANGQELIRPYVTKFSPHNLLLFAVGGQSGRISLVRGQNALADERLLHVIEHSYRATGDAILDLTFLKSAENWICAGSGDHLVHFIDIVEFKTVSLHVKHLGSVKYVTETSKGILSGGSDGSVCLWDRRVSDPVFFMQLKNQASVSALIAPTEDIFISGDAHGKVTAWDFRKVSNHNQLMQIPLPATENRNSVSYMAMSPDKARMASLLTNNTLVVHRLDGSWRYSARQWANIGAFNVRCCFSPDSEYIITGTTTGALCIFRTSHGVTPQMLLGHTAASICVDWCENSFDHICSCGDDRVIHLWSSEYSPLVEFHEEEELPEVDYVSEASGRAVPSFYTLHHFLQ